MSEWTKELQLLANRNNAEARQLLKELASKDLGFVGRKSGKNHVIIKHTIVPRCTASLSLTPGDKRAFQNKKGDIQRMISQVIQATETAKNKERAMSNSA
jgi:hypothetical protein